MNLHKDSLCHTELSFCVGECRRALRELRQFTLVLCVFYKLDATFAFNLWLQTPGLPVVVVFIALHSPSISQCRFPIPRAYRPKTINSPTGVYDYSSNLVRGESFHAVNLHIPRPYKAAQTWVFIGKTTQSHVLTCTKRPMVMIR